MNRIFILILLIFQSFGLLSQEKDVPYYKEEQKLNKYEKTKNYQGPTDWYTQQPAAMSDDEDYYSGGNYGNSQNGIQHTPSTIQRYRQDKFNRGQNGNSNEPEKILESDVMEDPKNLPSVDIDPPTSAWDFFKNFWNVVLIIIVIALLLLIIYFIIKGIKPPNKKITHDVEDSWNPEIISKTELELKLEDAENAENFRECVRIYFTFILKDLIQLRLISWKKDKTNHDYLLEMSESPYYSEFNSCVNIYDIVWYGEYEIDKEIYNKVRPVLSAFYQKIEVKSES